MKREVSLPSRCPLLHERRRLGALKAVDYTAPQRFLE